MKQTDVGPFMDKWMRELEKENIGFLRRSIEVWQDEVTKIQLRILVAQAIIIEREEVNG